MLSTANKKLDQILDGMDQVFRQGSELLFGANPRELFDIEATLSASIFQVRGGARLSILEIQGAHSVSGQDQYANRIDLICETLKPRLSKKGQFVKVIFESSPTDTAASLDRNFAPERMQAKRMGLDVEDLINEKVQVNSKYVQIEKAWLCIYTTTDALDRTMIETDDVRVANALGSVPMVGDSQPIYGLLTKELNNLHVETVSAISDRLTKDIDCGLALRLLTVEEGLKNIECSLYGPASVGEAEYDLMVISDEERERRKIRRSNRLIKSIRDVTQESLFRSATSKNSSTLETFLPAPIRDQIIHTQPLELQSRYVVFGTRVHVPLMVTRHVDAPQDFDRLVRMLKGSQYRIAFTITPDGLSGDSINSGLAGYFSWLPGNKDTTLAREQLAAIKADDPCVGLSISVSTWCDLDVSLVDGKEHIELNRIRELQNKLSARVQDWGGVTIDNSFGDLVEGLFSTIPGLIGRHVANPTPAPLSDTVAMLPISRMACAWLRGSTLYRTEDGKPYYFEQYSELQAAWISLVTGPMGYGKSSEMFSRNFWYLIQSAETAHLPLLRGIDFSYSQKGLVDLVRNSLPENRRHEAQYIRAQNHEDFAWNPFRTLLGCREPLESQRSFLVNLLMAATTSLASYGSREGLIRTVVNRAYERYSDADHNPNAKAYAQGLDGAIDDRLEELDIKIDQGTAWWAVVDAFFKAGDTRYAALAQSWAEPTLDDLGAVAANPSVRSEYNEQHNGIPVVDLFSRTLRDASEKLPFLRGRTRMDISDSPIVIFDLADMVGDGSASPSQANHNAIVLMSFLRMLCADFWMDIDQVPFINPAYQDHHAEIIRRNSTLKKRLFGDEKHRTNGSIAFDNEIDRMTVEARKFKVDLMLGSHTIADFPPKTVKYATAVTMCGAGSIDAVKEISDVYGLNETQRGILKGISPPTKVGARVLHFVDTNTYGKQVADVYNTDGPLMLWAKATYSEDRELRASTYLAIGDQSKARRVLAKAFPSGTCRHEITRRKELMAQRLYESPTGNLFRDMLEELVTISKTME